MEGSWFEESCRVTVDETVVIPPWTEVIIAGNLEDEKRDNGTPGIIEN